MKIKPAYRNFGNWLRSLSTVRYALFVWSVTFIFSLLVGISLVGNNPVNATMSAAGGAIGVTVVLTIMEKRGD